MGTVSCTTPDRLRREDDAKVYRILSHVTRVCIAAIEAPSLRRALEIAARERVALRDADLRHAALDGAILPRINLRGANLRGANLTDAYLAHADLSDTRLAGASLVGANCRGADFRHAQCGGHCSRDRERGLILRRITDLTRADLRDCRLHGFNARGARLTDVLLAGASIDWRWHQFAAEILRQERGKTPANTGLIEAVDAAREPRPWAWTNVLAGCGDAAAWAIAIWRRHLQPGDNAPEMFWRPEHAEVG